MKDSKIPSLLAFSTMLLFYGNKQEIKEIVSILKKGGREFFKEKVLKGAFFKSNIVDSNQVEINFGAEKRYFRDMLNEHYSNPLNSKFKLKPQDAIFRNINLNFTSERRNTKLRQIA